MRWARIELDGQPSHGVVAGDTGDPFAGYSDTGEKIRMEAARRRACRTSIRRRLFVESV